MNKPAQTADRSLRLIYSEPPVKTTPVTNLLSKGRGNPQAAAGIPAATAIALLLAVAATALLLAGCKSMADPDGTGMPWTERSTWEYAPNLPMRMLEN